MFIQGNSLYVKLYSCLAECLKLLIGAEMKSTAGKFRDYSTKSLLQKYNQYPAEIKTRTLLSIFIVLVILTVDVAVIRFIRWQELIFTGMLSGLQLPTAVTLAAL